MNTFDKEHPEGQCDHLLFSIDHAAPKRPKKGKPATKAAKPPKS
ncbi:MAG: hypothetical protein ACHQUB_01010 [Candidatus Saccharimonadia bacterium]